MATGINTVATVVAPKNNLGRKFKGRLETGATADVSPKPRLAAQIAWLDRNLPLHKNFMRMRQTWLTGPRERARMMDIDPEFKDPHALSAVNKQLRDGSVTYMQQKFKDRPDLAKKMLPDHPIMSARPLITDIDYNIYHALLRDNVTLVSEGIDRITENGVVARDGTEHKADMIVLATGFRPTDFLFPMDVRGRDGKQPSELWAKDGPRAYIGTQLPGFPNFFMIYGPNTNPNGGVSVVNHEDLTARYIVECLGYLISEEKRSMEPTIDAYWRYNEELDHVEKRKIYTDKRAHNYYRTDFGTVSRSAVNCPLSGQRVLELLRRPNADDLIID